MTPSDSLATSEVDSLSLIMLKSNLTSCQFSMTHEFLRRWWWTIMKCVSLKMFLWQNIFLRPVSIWSPVNHLPLNRILPFHFTIIYCLIAENVWQKMLLFTTRIIWTILSQAFVFVSSCMMNTFTLCKPWIWQCVSEFLIYDNIIDGFYQCVTACTEALTTIQMT